MKRANSLAIALSALILCSTPVISLTIDLNNSSPVPNIEKDSTHSNLTTPEKNFFNAYVNEVYQTVGLQQTGLPFGVFEKAITGFINLKTANHLNKNKEVLTIVDFSQPSTAKRMWIIDVKNKTLLLNTHVAHGRGSGENMATKFSNISESHQSSLGFYVTSETYFGKHGLSLRLDGYDKGINHMARARAIVVHGASYVSESFINQHGRLGRSHGCPAVAQELTPKIIGLIKDKTCLFINGENKNYHSVYLDTQKAENIFSAANHLKYSNSSI